MKRKKLKNCLIYFINGMLFAIGILAIIVITIWLLLGKNISDIPVFFSTILQYNDYFYDNQCIKLPPNLSTIINDEISARLSFYDHLVTVLVALLSIFGVVVFMYLKSSYKEYIYDIFDKERKSVKTELKNDLHTGIDELFEKHQFYVKIESATAKSFDDWENVVSQKINEKLEKIVANTVEDLIEKGYLIQQAEIITVPDTSTDNKGVK